MSCGQRADTAVRTIWSRSCVDMREEAERGVGGAAGLMQKPPW